MDNWRNHNAKSTNSTNEGFPNWLPSFSYSSSLLDGKALLGHSFSCFREKKEKISRKRWEQGHSGAEGSRWGGGADHLEKRSNWANFTTTTQVPRPPPLHLTPPSWITSKSYIFTGRGWPTFTAVTHFQQIPPALDEAREKTFLCHYTLAKRNYC